MEWLGLPVNASADGGSIDVLILLLHILMAVLFVGWSIFFVFVLVRFRKGANPKASYAGTKGKYSKYAEVGVVVAEAVLLVVAVWYWIPLKASPPSPEQDSSVVEVHVIAEQFAWNIHYPGPDGKFGERKIDLVSSDNTIGLDRESPGGADDLVTINQLHLPADRPALVRLSSKDVIHSFSLPEFRVKQDAIPGLEFPVYFTPTMTTEEMHQHSARTLQLPTDMNPQAFIAWEDVEGPDGNVMVKKGMPIFQTTIDALLEANIDSIQVTRGYQIACAQLCGLGHYRMVGSVVVHDEEGYEAWLEEQAEYL